MNDDLCVGGGFPGVHFRGTRGQGCELVERGVGAGGVWTLGGKRLC